MKAAICQVITAGYPWAEHVNCIEASFQYDSRLPANRRIFDHNLWKITVGAADCLAAKRNRGVKAFLASDADVLVFIDDDQVFDPDAVHDLVASVTPERPIVSALIMAERNRGIPISPACAGWDGQTFRQFHTIPTDRYWQVGVVGTGFVAIHRDVLVEMAERHKDDAWPWFKFGQWQPDPDDDPSIMGEDYVFALRAHALGHPVVVDTRLHVGHIKKRVLTVRHFWDQWPSTHWPPSVVAIVPVKDRLSYTKGVVKQLVDDERVDDVVVVDNGSNQQTRAWLDKQPITVLKGDGMGIHAMWNQGTAWAFEYHPRPYCLFLNNDVRVGDGMAGHLLDALEQGPPDLVFVCPNYDGRNGQGVERLQGVCGERYDGSGGLAGFAFMVRPEWFQSGWRFPEELKWWWGDTDMVLSADMNGAWYGMVHAATVEHLDGGGRTGDWQSPEMQAQLAEDQRRFQAKWQPIFDAQREAS